MIHMIVYGFYAYILAGVFYALWFILFGVNRLDEGMHGVSWKLRVLLFPGSTLLWPVLLIKFLRHP